MTLLELEVLVLVDASGEMFPSILVSRCLRVSTNVSTHKVHRVLDTIQYDGIWGDESNGLSGRSWHAEAFPRLIVF